MAIRIVEFFGYTPGGSAGKALADRKHCPFVDDSCLKPRHGACTLQALKDVEAVICCPNRLYANKFRLLNDIGQIAFGEDIQIITAKEVKIRLASGAMTGHEVVAFGKYWGGELPLPKGSKSDTKKVSGSYYMDWILAKVSTDGTVNELTAIEVQTIDTTGNYSAQSEAFFQGLPFVDAQGRNPGYSNSGFNWENVNKRILPQVIYKGHALRREPKCTKGLFFCCPRAVFERIRDRLGNSLHEYHPSSGTITFVSYSLDEDAIPNRPYPLSLVETFTTTVDQVCLAFSSPQNLPPASVYEQAINASLRK